MDRTEILFPFLYICLILGWSHPQVVNVARDKPAEQKRDYTGYFTWSADKAVDGCYLRDDPEVQGCCSLSVLDLYFDDPADNYWRLNLTQLYQVESIVIYARTDVDQLSGFTLHTIREPGNLEVQVPTVTPVDNVYTFTFSPLEDVTEIVVRRTSDDHCLVICEVAVIAACPDGFYGINCKNRCSGGCANNTACDKTTGACTEGCESGFFGELCNQCGNCLNHVACDAITGICTSGCADGWRGDYCTEECPGGTFGSNCSEACGQCINNCNFVNGSCSGNCLAGWQGELCNEACSDGTYGLNCSMSCGNCLNGEQCNHVNGTCPSHCDPGWEGNMCNTTCSNNRYGDNCNMTCGQCLGGAQCDHINGACNTGCDAGWEGDMCDTADITNATDCKALYDDGVTTSGVYTIQPHTSNYTFKAYCDMVTDGGGWTVFQRREDGKVNFEVGWDSYRDGFGSPAGEHWLGLEHLNQIISQRPHEMRVDMVDWANVTKYAYYNDFTISSASDKYRLSISGYNGTAGDSMTYHNNQQFSTPGSDNDVYDRDCAGLYKGGWWYKSCHYSNLNGHYVPGGSHKTNADGVNWYHWHGYHYSLKKTEMKLRLIV